MYTEKEYPLYPLCVRARVCVYVYFFHNMSSSDISQVRTRTAENKNFI
jgi:hypothetical protein